MISGGPCRPEVKGPGKTSVSRRRGRRCTREAVDGMWCAAVKCCLLRGLGKGPWQPPRSLA